MRSGRITMVSIIFAGLLSAQTTAQAPVGPSSKDLPQRSLEGSRP